MDHSAKLEALKTAKMIISSHGLTCHMNKYNKDALTREIPPNATSLRYEFHLEPTRDSWSASNASCTLSVAYNVDQKGARVADDGSVVIDNHLKISVGVGGSDMDLATFRRREDMTSMLFMLCEMLETSLPPITTSLLETAREAEDRKRRDFEQRVSIDIMTNVGHDSLKGLRKGGSAKSFRLTESFCSATGKYPEPGTYLYRYVRSTDRRGRPKDIAFYSIRVFGSIQPGDPPGLLIRRIEEV